MHPASPLTLDSKPQSPAAEPASAAAVQPSLLGDLNVQDRVDK